MTENLKTRVQKVAYGLSAHFCHTKTPPIAIWTKTKVVRGGVGWRGVGILHRPKEGLLMFAFKDRARKFVVEVCIPSLLLDLRVWRRQGEKESEELESHF